MDACIKQEHIDEVLNVPPRRIRTGVVSPIPPASAVIQLSSSSDSDSEPDLDGLVAGVVESSALPGGGSPTKRRKMNDDGGVLPLGFLSPLPPPSSPSPAVLSLPAPQWASSSARMNGATSTSVAPPTGGSRQFWKAGDYDGAPSSSFESSSTGELTVKEWISCNGLENEEEDCAGVVLFFVWAKPSTGEAHKADTIPLSGKSQHCVPILARKVKHLKLIPGSSPQDCFLLQKSKIYILECILCA
ncbi:hypothetical protein PIB30_018928 [Stylosanthes scabra]|uniref:Uncharacterized protein n=1 Tax=Stylosanthes scabra TaxID=79078 RepID=A0ABU6Y7P8_9FABA|nr:hypothetical protein [Stylosanthes scabra]